MLKRIALVLSLIAAVSAVSPGGAITPEPCIFGDRLSPKARQLASAFFQSLGLKGPFQLRGSAGESGALVARLDDYCIGDSRRCLTLFGWIEGDRLSHTATAMLTDISNQSDARYSLFGEPVPPIFFYDHNVTVAVRITSKAVVFNYERLNRFLIPDRPRPCGA